MRANLTDLNSMGLLAFNGKDAKTFLQGQVTCDLNKISPELSSLGAHCNLKGRMQSCFRIVMPHDDSYYLSLPSAMIPLTLLDFKKYAMFSKVTITDMAGDWLRLGLDGEDAAPLLSSTFDLNEFALEINGCQSITSNSATLTICRVPGENRYEIFAPKTVFSSQLAELSNSCQKGEPNRWDLLDIQAGIPTVYPATIDKLLPHHVNLVELGGVSFDKGCYLGQEVVARMQWRGNIKKHMVQAEVAGLNQAPQAGDPVYAEHATDNEAPGMVVRSTAKPSGGFLLLMVLDLKTQAAHLESSNGPRLTLQL